MEKNPDEFIRRKRKEKFQIKIKNALKIILVIIILGFFFIWINILLYNSILKAGYIFLLPQ